MVRFLPPQPSLVYLKNEAKALQKAHQRKEPAVCATLRRMHRFKASSDEQILATELSLTEAQFALAMDSASAFGLSGGEFILLVFRRHLALRPFHVEHARRFRSSGYAVVKEERPSRLLKRSISLRA